MIQITPDRVIIEDSQLARLRAEYKERRCVILPRFLGPSLCDHLIRKLEVAKFVTKFEVSEASGQFGQTLFVPETETAFFLFQLLLNRPALFQAVREITGCSPIGHFLGRLHRSSPGLQHQIDWHEDHGVQRLVGISISLSREAYTGGLFQLREKRSEQVLCVIGQLPIGDAFLFDIDPDFQHRLTLVEAGGERTVGVGWFHSVEAWPTFARDYLLPGRRHSDSHQPEI